MREWIVTACRAEAKIFDRNNTDKDLHWLKTLTNKKGRKKEREFETDGPGFSYAKFSGTSGPHALEGKHQHSEIIANRFAKQIARFVIQAFEEKKFNKLTVFAGTHFIGLLKVQFSQLEQHCELNYIAKNIEKTQTEKIESYLA